MRAPFVVLPSVRTMHEHAFVSTVDDIRRLLREGRPQAEVARLTGRPATTVAYHARVLALEAALRGDAGGDGSRVGSWRG